MNFRGYWKPRLNFFHVCLVILSTSLIIGIQILRYKLSVDKILVEAILHDEFLMGTTLLDLTTLHHNNLICITDSAQSVSYDDNCLFARGDKTVKSLLYLMFTVSIESTGSLVKKQNLWLSDQSSGNCNSLLLSSWELDSSLSNYSIVRKREQVFVVKHCPCGSPSPWRQAQEYQPART